MGFRVLDATFVLLFVDRFEVSSEYIWGCLALVVHSPCFLPILCIGFD